MLFLNITLNFDILVIKIFFHFIDSNIEVNDSQLSESDSDFLAKKTYF